MYLHVMTLMCTDHVCHVRIFVPDKYYSARSLQKAGRLCSVGQGTRVCLGLTQMKKGSVLLLKSSDVPPPPPSPSWTGFMSKKTVKFLNNRVRCCSVVSFSPNTEGFFFLFL